MCMCVFIYIYASKKLVIIKIVFNVLERYPPRLLLFDQIQ